MPLNISITTTSGVAVTQVPDDVATDLQAVYDALKDLPVNRQAVVDFNDAKAARLFIRQGKAWATSQGLEFRRRGNAKSEPTRVQFRIYKPRDKAKDDQSIAGKTPAKLKTVK